MRQANKPSFKGLGSIREKPQYQSISRKNFVAHDISKGFNDRNTAKVKMLTLRQANF